MLWFGKQAKADSTGGDPNRIEPLELGISLDEGIAQSKLNSLVESLEERGGPQAAVAALSLKAELFAKAFPEDRPESITRASITAVLECVFPARRKVASILAELGDDTLDEAFGELVYGKAPLFERMTAFCELVPVEQKKPRRAIWDLAAELLHFRAPEQIPLMTRWVWDINTQSGALREFVKANDTMERLPFGAEPGVYEAARAWFAESLGTNGFYRDLPFMIDLLQAQAYSEYVKSVSTGIGLVDAEFGGRQDPAEFVLKLLGVEARARDRKKAQSATQEPTLH